MLSTGFKGYTVPDIKKAQSQSGYKVKFIVSTITVLKVHG